MEFYVPSIITKNTPILTDYDMDIRTSYQEKGITCHGKNVYQKPFNLNEMIGEYLAKKHHIKTAEYFIYYNIPRKSYSIASTDFKEEKKNYYTLESLPILYRDDYALDDIIEKQKELLNSILSMVALDYYMLQQDRNTSNYLFEQWENGTFSIAPLYDYSDSFDAVSYYHYDRVVDKEDFYHFYDNGLVTLTAREDFDKMFEKYPTLKEKLKEMTNTDLLAVIADIEHDFSINIGEDAKENYKKDEEISQKILRKVLK